MLHLRIHELAQARQLTQAQLQRCTGLSPTTIRRYWHNRVHRVDLAVLDTFATVLHVPVSDLFASHPEA